MSQLSRQARQTSRVSLLVKHLTSPSYSRERSGLLAPAPIVHGAQTPMPLTPPLLVGATTSGRSRMSLAGKPARPLSSLSLAHELAQQTSSMSKAHDIACQTSPSYSRERSGLLAPHPLVMGGKHQHRQHHHCLLEQPRLVTRGRAWCKSLLVL
jgi:hypothetical protein